MTSDMSLMPLESDRTAANAGRRCVATHYTRYMTIRSKPFSVRLPEHAATFVEAEAQRTRRSRGSIVAELAEEAARARTFPGIGFRDGPAGRRAWLEGTGLDIWQVIAAYEDAESIASSGAESGISPAQARTCLAYYERFPEEIDELIALSRRPLEELRREYPFIEVLADSV